MRRVDKPWGYEIIWAETDQYIGKILHIDRGQMLSLQMHEFKDETLFVQRGKIDLVLQDESGQLYSMPYGEYKTFRIPPKTVHRIIAIEDTDLLEVSTAHPDDIIRLQDEYGRV
jgi:oxalate decarboxylase/phosphoglucose isomerase-like protein (cupin superfamily)